MSIAYRVSGWNRKRKWKLFLNIFKPNRSMRVLDVGYTEKEYSSTDNFIEKHYPFPENLTALGINDAGTISQRYPKVKFVQYTGKIFPFKDKEFDLCWSNAVIEHVGSRNDQLYYLMEIKRVSNRAFLTTPNKYFPIEVHTRTPFIHFLPKDLFDRYLCLIGKKWGTGSYMNLLGKADFRKLLELARIEHYPSVPM